LLTAVEVVVWWLWLFAKIGDGLSWIAELAVFILRPN
jgi:hypothetical protein